MSFVWDLSMWQQAEKLFVFYMLNTRDVVQVYMPQGKFKDYDIQFCFKDWSEETYEIKRDMKTQDTWNFVIETRFKWQASWIYTSKADYIIYYVMWKFYKQSRWELILRLQDCEKRITKWWDWFNSELYIIKADKLNDLFDVIEIDERMSFDWLLKGQWDNPWLWEQYWDIQ